MLSDFSFSMPTVGRKALLFVLLLVIVEWLQRGKEHGLQFPDNAFFRCRGVRWATYYLLFMMSLLMAGRETDFIYFQF